MDGRLKRNFFLLPGYLSCLFRRSKNVSGGFTLLELSFVFLLLGTACTLAFPQFKSALAGCTLYTAARQMASEIRTVQQEALTTGKMVYRISFDLSGGLYLVQLNTRVLKTVSLPAGVRMTLKFPDPDQRILEFNARGLPVTAGTIILQESRTGSCYYVIIAPVTGRVRISPFPPETWF